MSRVPPASDAGNSRRLLRAVVALDHFRLAYAPAADDLAPYAERHWILHWDLRGRGPHRQRVLTDPAVNMTFTTGGRARVVGVTSGVFSETIEGSGRVIGVRFLPGGFRPLLGAPVAILTDRMAPVDDLFGPRARTVADKIIAADDQDEAIGLLEGFLRSLLDGPPDPLIAEVSGIVERIAADPAIMRVSGLAGASGVSSRRLQRLFAEYVGVGPKWVIRRCRIQEAAGRAADGADVDWAALAAELGYSDQAHFIREFTATVGMSPARYARQCARDRAADEAAGSAPGKIGT